MVSIIVLSYNTASLLESCLTSLITYAPKTPYEIIVVDNASHDESVSLVKKKFPRVRLIENKENAGFAKGGNIGARHAKGDFLLFFNSDAQLQKPLDEMISFLQKNDTIGVVGGKLLASQGQTSHSHGRFFTLWNTFLFFFFGDKFTKQKSESMQQVDWVSGGFMLIKKDLFEKIGGFDEHFFMYIEDMELCYRVKHQGKSVYFYPHAVALHLAQGSSNRSFAIHHIFQGTLYFYKRHHSVVEYYIVKLMLMLKAVILFSVGILTGNKYLADTYKKEIHL